MDVIAKEKVSDKVCISIGNNGEPVRPGTFFDCDCTDYCSVPLAI